MNIIQRPLSTSYPSNFEHYISLAPDDVLHTLARQIDIVAERFQFYSEKENYRYDVAKWTVKEILGHLIDFERVFVYRMTCISRLKTQHLPDFDQDLYLSNSSYCTRNYQDLLDEFITLRKANMYFFRSLSEEELERFGTASGKRVQVKAMLFVCAGHINHHLAVLKDRY